MKKKQTYKYYFVAYTVNNGAGNLIVKVESDSDLDFKLVENQIVEKHNGVKWCTVSFFTRISKKSFDLRLKHNA